MKKMCDMQQCVGNSASNVIIEEPVCFRIGILNRKIPKNT